MMGAAAILLLIGLAACDRAGPDRPPAEEAVRAMADTVMPKGWFDLLAEGTVLRAQRKYGEAIAVFEKGVTAYPDHADAHRELAVTFDQSARLANGLDAVTRTSRLEASATHYEKALDLGAGRDSTEPWSQLIGLYDQGLERVADAERIARRMVIERPDLSGSWENLARLLEKQGQTQQAAQALLDADRRVTRWSERRHLAEAMLGLESRVPRAEQLRLIEAALGIAEAGITADSSEQSFPKLRARALEARNAAIHPMPR